MSGTVTGGTQTTNNIVGNLSYGLNVEGYTDQTAVSKQYLTATGLTATVLGRRVAYTITGQRGAAISFNSTTKRVDGGMNWDYKNVGTYTGNFATWHRFDTEGSFATKCRLYTSLGSQSVTLQLATPVVVGDPIIPKHDQSFFHRDETELSEHEESFMGRTY